MNRKILIYSVIGVALVGIVAVAYKKAVPPHPGTTAALSGTGAAFNNAAVMALPNQAVSTSEVLTPYSLLGGVGGVVPKTTFPDINGDSHNVVFPT